MQKWEYLIVSTDGVRATLIYSHGLTPQQLQATPMIWDLLNQLGSEGWELVSGAEDGFFYLKREK